MIMITCLFTLEPGGVKNSLCFLNTTLLEIQYIWNYIAFLSTRYACVTSARQCMNVIGGGGKYSCCMN